MINNYYLIKLNKIEYLYNFDFENILLNLVNQILLLKIIIILKLLNNTNTKKVLVYNT